MQSASHKFSITVFFAFILLSICLRPTSVFGDVNVQNGEKLFKQYCTSCHKLDVKLIGPPLRDVNKRRSEDWLIKWVRNNTALRTSGDKDAIALYEGYKIDMPQFPNLSDDDIRSILAYVNLPPLTTPAAPETTPLTPSQPPYLLYGVIGLLMIVIIFLLRTNSILLRSMREKSGEHLSEKKTLREIITSKKFIWLCILIFIFLSSYALTDAAIHLGHSKNYQPTQPIAFSHKIHAGIGQINCIYCHSGAEKSKTAGIPPLSTCMNCHKAIREGENGDQTKEIQKLYSYYNNDKPIQWIKIHNLPDHVYFNHSQHIVVGLIECQTCHGPVEQMDQVYQYTSLSMGWCINCHRETDVKFAANNYYSMFTDMQKQIRDSTGAVKDSGNVHITEEMVGGTECQKCHY